ncbi:Ig-like domain-containing protein, partial [Deinococcus yavapaiensis]
MKRNHKLLSVLLTVGLVACGQPALPALTGSAPAASQPSNLPGAQLSATRQLGFVQLSFSDIMGDLKAGAHVSDGGAFSSQSLTQQPSVGVTLLKKGVTIVGNFRYIWGTYTITNNTTAPVTNLTLLGVNRSTYNGGSSVSSATLVSGDPASDQVVWQTAPSQAVLSDGSIDPARADFVAYNESDITDSIKQYAASRTIPITTVFPFGFVARSGTTPTATASRSIAAGATGTLTVSFRVPASTNLNAFNWNGIILVDSRARVARGVQEGQISADGVSGRADNVPTSEVDVALLGQDTNQANCVTPSKCTTIRIDDVRIAGGPGTNVQTVTLLPHPIFVDPGTLTTNEQELLAVTFSASDTSGTPSVFTAEEPLPAGATLLPSGAFSWTPTGSQAGSYTIKIRATNGNGSYTVLTKQITVVDNTAPVFNTINSPASVNENAAVSFPVSATDADNDTLTYDAVVVTQNGTAALSTIGATFSGGTFNWTPSFTQSGSYTIRFKASDGTTETTKDVTINVTDVNRAPTLNTITTPQAVNEGQALNFTVSGSDADNDTLTYDAVVVTQNGTAALSTIGATLSSSGAFSWTPSFTQSGSYTIRFTSNDGKTSSQAQDVTINVGDANRAPVFNTINSPASVNENAAVSFPVSATDADNDTLTYDAVVVTQNGTAALSTIGATFSGGTFNWTPSFTQSGSYTIRFKASDGTTETTKDVTINVTDVNRAPTLNTITTPQAVNEGQALNFTVSGSDADNDTLTYDAVVVTQNGTAALSTIGATLSSSGAFSWTPSFTQSGSYTIRFTSNDGKTSSQAQDVTINVA